MNRYSAVIVLMVLSAGCTHAKKTETQPQPPPVVAKPETAKAPQTATATPATGTAKTTPAKGTAKAPAKGTTTAVAATGTKTPAKPATATNSAKTGPPPVTKAQPAAPAKQPAAAPTLDLDALEARLKQTKGIGLMTKLSLKNQVDDLLGEFRKHYSGKPMPTLTELRRSYDLLMMKVLSLLQDHDQQLASDILSSRERIWGLLADPKSFAALDA
jgi:hypothetical protein